MKTLSVTKKMKTLRKSIRKFVAVAVACFCTMASKSHAAYYNPFAHEFKQKGPSWSEIRKQSVYCSPYKNPEECKKLDYRHNYYVALIGGPVILFNYKNFDGFSYGGFTADIGFGIQHTYKDRYYYAFEIKQFNQFFFINSEDLGIADKFDLDSNLHGLQFKFIKGYFTGKNNNIKPYRFAAFDLGGGRLHGITENDNVDFVAPTFGGAIAFGIEWEINEYMDIGVEFPVGVTVLMHERPDGATLTPFPDVYPNISLKFSF